ncbi:UDP-glucose 6-dehydrogenase [Candidatus Peregrinibacteria bacterium CG10_big_fil_rev_8_21_14_0_10_49_10]|nr:MAG: UDP-glucose 6-dehydrogenase [Candidatus Peregrinibacteria bacterium CG10_big_fil_rev_8_21_14_0_10_49_10]
MNLAVVGTGYVGLVSAACFAELGHTVVGVDIDEEKVKKLKKGICTIYEPGLEELLQRGLQTGRLSFTTDLLEALPDAKMIFSAVATPPNKDYSADLNAVFTVAETVAENIDHSIVFVNKSTVPVGTGRQCEERMKKIVEKRGLDVHIPVISNPEFLREGCAVQDTLQPDRIVVGINGNVQATEFMEELYQPLTRVGKPLLCMERESAEMVKYASNAFLATKISFINMLSELCEKTGGNIRDIAKGMGLDDRIGPRFLHAGIGYGGSCFPKDVKALMALSKETGIPLPIVEATHKTNDHQRKRFFEKFLSVLPEKATVAVWGLSFKPKTDDMREAPSLDLIPVLVDAGHTVRAHDPVAMENAKKILPQITYTDAPLAAAEEADAIIVLTEWDTFRGIDLSALKATMKGRYLFDGRNIYEPEEVRNAGLTYVGIGIN